VKCERGEIEEKESISYRRPWCGIGGTNRKDLEHPPTTGPDRRSMRVGPENCLACEADNSGLLAPRPLEGLALDRRGASREEGKKGWRAGYCWRCWAGNRRGKCQENKMVSCAVGMMRAIDRVPIKQDDGLQLA